MTDHDQERFSELGRRTEDVRPSAGFEDAVMAAIEADVGAGAAAGGERQVPSLRLAEGVSRFGWVAVALSAVAAAASIIISIEAQNSFDEDVLVVVDTVEVGE